ncbi:MAG: helix-turn-helix domain-containing protein [Azospirillaceae bacterium]
MTRRRYTLKDRARSQAETRLRIVEATMHLHEELGPRSTTISAIAERAGVQRLTVYRHFADETALFQACTAHWLALNPPPDPAGWTAIADPRRRAATALAAIYAYFQSSRAMLTGAYRDEPLVPALQAPMRELRGHLDGIADALAAAIPAPAHAGREQVKATLRHLLSYECWQLLERRGLDEPAKVHLAIAWIDGAMSATPAD